MQDWRIAIRTLLRRPGYAAAAILMLTFGIGTTTTVFSVVDAMLFKPLPYPDPDRLVVVMEASPQKNKKDSLIAPARLEDWNRANQTFVALAGVYTENVTDTSGTEPQRLTSWRVSPRFFDVYGTRPLAGRTLSQQEETASGPLAAVISYGLWTRRFGQDPRTVGKRLVIGGAGCTIVGIMPKTFGRHNVDLWLPAQTAPAVFRQREARYFSGIGRMKPGVTIQQARADLARVQHRLGEQYPHTDRDWSAVVRDLKETRVGDYRRMALFVFGAVGLLFLIAIANIAGLTLAQLQRRQREMAIRTAMGATRWNVVATVLREVLLVGAAGALLGGTAASWGVKAATVLLADLPRMSELQFDWRAMTFTVLLTILAACVFGTAPAWQSTRVSLTAAMAQGSRSVSGGRRAFQRALVVAQLGGTVALLSGAGLLLRSYYNLGHVDSGFSTENAVAFHVGTAWNEDRPMIGGLQTRIVEELGRFPGVEATGITSALPGTAPVLRMQVQVEGLAETMQAATFSFGARTINSGYLQALQVPLLAGEWCKPMRPFESNGANQSLVNRQFVEQYAKGRNVIGKHTFYPMSMIANPPMNVIVGIVDDVREDGIASSPAPFVYDCASAGSLLDPEYVVRTRGNPTALLRQIPQIIHGIDPTRAVFGLKMLDKLMDDALEQPRLNMRFLTIFASSAMLLASVGLYSLISMVVAARTREIGVRMALGAQPGRIAALVLADAGGLLLAGVLLGVIAALVTNRVLRSVLFGVSPLDPLTLTSAILVLVMVSTIAASVPARRAAAIDPLGAIRAE